ncbi:MAG: IMP dehydrogenase [Gammaproteobacteria bacterium]|nr:IMP dehydrogenase [Gammaproteobacteria bacterium]
MVPNACKDQQGTCCGPPPRRYSAETEERVEALVEAGVDVIVVDTAHGHSRGVIDQVKRIKGLHPELGVIGGNIATAEAALALVEAGADAVKVGIGPGSICTTRIVTGIGVPQITAVAEVAAALEGSDVPVIADGGIRFSGDLAKAMAAGAHVVMIGSLLAGTDEAPGEVELFQGRSYKAYRGMGSMGAMSQAPGPVIATSRTPRATTAEAGARRHRGHGALQGPDGAPSSHRLMGGLRAQPWATPVARHRDHAHAARSSSGSPHAGMSESHVHDVSITKEAPNYRAGADAYCSPHKRVTMLGARARLEPDAERPHEPEHPRPERFWFSTSVRSTPS